MFLSQKAFVMANILMISITEIAYLACLNNLKNLIPQLSPEIVVTDFETSLRNACLRAFPSCTLIGSNDHHDYVINFYILLHEILFLMLTIIY